MDWIAGRAKEEELVILDRYTVTLLRGDGIGPEVVEATLGVMQKVAQKFGFSWALRDVLLGGAAIDKTGLPLPRETVETCKAGDAVLLGAVGGPKWDALPGELRPEKGLLGIRSELNLFANLRPAVVYGALRAASPLKSEILGDSLDILVVRELTGGIYFGERGRMEKDGELGAYDTEYYSVDEVVRIARVAFEAARKRGKKLCSVDKANVLESSRLWRETMVRVAQEYTDVALEHMYVDNAAMQLVRDPHQFDVIVTSNMFGDILSDEASQITGSIGMLPSASLGAGKLGLYEPIHGSAPDIAGKNAANPLASILSAAMLLRYSLDRPEAADCIEAAVVRVLEAGHRSADLARNGETPVGTKQMGELVADAL